MSLTPEDALAAYIANPQHVRATKDEAGRYHFRKVDPLKEGETAEVRAVRAAGILSIIPPPHLLEPGQRGRLIVHLHNDGGSKALAAARSVLIDADYAHRLQRATAKATPWPGEKPQAAQVQELLDLLGSPPVKYWIAELASATDSASAKLFEETFYPALRAAAAYSTDEQMKAFLAEPDSRDLFFPELFIEAARMGNRSVIEFLGYQPDAKHWLTLKRDEKSVFDEAKESAISHGRDDVTSALFRIQKSLTI